LIVDPRVGILQPLAERGVRLPMQISLNERAVAVAPWCPLYEDETLTSIRGATSRIR